MNYLPKIEYLSIPFWQTVALDFVIVILLLVFLRWLSARVAAVKSGIEELSKQDNIAFGISVAGRMLALCVILSAAVSHTGRRFLLAAPLHTLVVGVLGLLLILLGRWMHDRLVLMQIREQKQIGRRNHAVALVEACAALSCAIALRESMLTAHASYGGLVLQMTFTLLVQLSLFYLCTHVLHPHKSTGGNFQQALAQGHLAIALSHSGKLLASGLAVATATKLFHFEFQAIPLTFVSLFIASVCILLLLLLFVCLAKWVILLGVDAEQEIEIQHNVGIAAIEASLFLGFGLIFSQLIVL